MPYEYMCHPALASDFWAINWVEGFKNATSSSDKVPSQVAAGPRHPSVLSLPLRTTMKFGWRPDMPDHRDLHVTFDKVNAPSQIMKKTEGYLSQSYLLAENYRPVVPSIGKAQPHG